MAGIRLTPEESDVASQGRSTAASDLISDDDRSVAADSWSIKSDYGSTLDDDQRHADATEALAAAATFPPPPSDYRLTPEESDVASQGRGTTASDLISDDDRSVAADSWSIKSDCGSTLDDDQRHADATKALAAAATFRPPPSDYTS